MVKADDRKYYFRQIDKAFFISPIVDMEKENADPSRMYVTSSSLAMDESLLDSVENANINTGNQENQE